jgi:hypothetical protein
LLSTEEEEYQSDSLLLRVHDLRGSGKNFSKTRAADEDTLDRMLLFQML